MPTLALSPRHRSLLSRLVALALACLVPLQGMAAGLVIAIGPAHTHILVPGAHLVLDDMRRTPLARRTPLDAEAGAIGHGHVHADGRSARHHHAPGDPTVVPCDDILRSLAGADGTGVSPSLAAFVAVLADVPRWLPEAAATTRAHHLPWSVRTHVPEPPERPPRVA